LFLFYNLHFFSFSGQFDLRCCVVGTSEWLRVVPWPGRPNFNYMKFSPFNINGVTKGLYKTYDNLTQMVVYGVRKEVF
jgi:hypothetical protein